MRKLTIFYSVLLIAVIGLMGMLWKDSHPEKIEARDYPQIKAGGILRIITEYNSTGYYISGDTIQGFQYELSQAIATLSGLEVETSLDMSLSNSFDKLQADQCDIIARNIPITSKNKEEYLFIDPLVLNKQVLVQRTKKANNGVAPLRNQLNLAGKTLHIPADSPSKLRLNNLIKEIGDTIYIKEDSIYSSEQLVIMVAKGDIDFAVCDKNIAAKAASFHPEVDIKTDISFTQLQAWAVRKTSPILLDSLNSWFNQMREKDTFNEIYKRYYSK